MTARAYLLTAATALICALALTACSSGTTNAQPAATPTPTPNSTYTAQDAAMCKILTGGMSDYAQLLIDAAQGTVTGDELAPVTSYMLGLEGDQTVNTRTMLTAYLGPYSAIADAASKGGGHVTFTTTAYKAASTQLLTYCGANR